MSEKEKELTKLMDDSITKLQSLIDKDYHLESINKWKSEQLYIRSPEFKQIIDAFEALYVGYKNQTPFMALMNGDETINKLNALHKKATEFNL